MTRLPAEPEEPSAGSEQAEPEDIYIVVQQGGSSCEWYATAYDTEPLAQEAAADHIEASYEAIGPFKLKNPKDPDVEEQLLNLIEAAIEAAQSV